MLRENPLVPPHRHRSRTPMPRLDFYFDQKHLVTIRLSADQLLIGRDPDCDIQLPDEKVSRIHAVITAEGAGHVLHDRSWNGTRLNLGRIEDPTPLAAGDRITIEDIVIFYQPDEAPVEELELGETVLGPDV
jgi:pSer/pThr/pTyr-binding forkhead associated (FHA) protein